jgi:hypothetical protein
MTIQFSRRIAIVFGILLPAVETIRRWHQLGDLSALPFWLDDWLIGGFLLLGAWKSRRDVEAGRPWLAAAVGFAAGMGYAAFFSQLATLDVTDPSGLSGITVVTIKGVLLAFAICALAIVLRPTSASRTS